jgi:hypothetical protein
MRKLLQSILCICLCPLLAAQEVTPQNAPQAAKAPVDAREPSSGQAADATPRPVSLPRDMHVTLRLEQSVSSANARKGEQVRFTLANDLIADGRIVAPTGSSCYAKIAQVRPRDARNSGVLKFNDPKFDLGLNLGAQQQVQFRRNPGTTPDEVEETVGFVVVALIMLPIVLPLAPFIAIHNKHHAKSKPQTTETEFIEGTNFDYFVRRTTIVRRDSIASPQQIKAAAER